MFGMTGLRTTKSSVSFKAPFQLSAFDAPLAAGNYEIETEEAIIEGNERTAYVRVATLLHLRSPGMVQIVTIDPQELERALTRDSRL
jgi:hypothetical protein